jgi:hypothetical protein
MDIDYEQKEVVKKEVEGKWVREYLDPKNGEVEIILDKVPIKDIDQKEDIFIIKIDKNALKNKVNATIAILERLSKIEAQELIPYIDKNKIKKDVIKFPNLDVIQKIYRPEEFNKREVNMLFRELLETAHEDATANDYYKFKKFFNITTADYLKEKVDANINAIKEAISFVKKRLENYWMYTLEDCLGRVWNIQRLYPEIAEYIEKQIELIKPDLNFIVKKALKSQTFKEDAKKIIKYARLKEYLVELI